MIIKSTFDKLVDAISLRCALVFDPEKQYLVCEACPLLFGCFIGFLFRTNIAIPSGALTDLHLQVKRINYSKRRFEVKATSVAIVLTEECSPLPDASFLG